MLYTHWRNEEVDLYGGYITFAERYTAIQQSLHQQIAQYESFAFDVTKAQALVTEQQASEQWDEMVPGAQHAERHSKDVGSTDCDQFATVNPQLHGHSGVYDLGIDIGLAGTNNSDGTALRYDMPEEQYYGLMRSLSKEQMDFLYDTVHLLKTSDKPLYRFLSGGAGTGKSYVLRALRETIERFFKSKHGTDFTESSCMTVAPTGKAAFLAGGNTIHSAFHLAANHSLAQYRSLDADSRNTLRSKIGHIRVWLIDEISMVGTRMFSFINQRLQEIHNTCRPFGGVSIIAFGDLYQLQPVLDGYIFDDFGAPAGASDCSVLAPNVWTSLFTMYELRQIMRQKDSVAFAQLLNRLREGQHTDDDIHMLRTRVISHDSPNYPFCAQHLFRTNALVETHNMHVYQTSTSDKYSIKAVDTVVGAVSDSVISRVLGMIPSDPRKTMKLPSQLDLVIGGWYELTINVDVTDGLANGAGGIVKSVHLTGDNNYASGIVWMQFDDIKIGSQTRSTKKQLVTPKIDNSWTPIQPVSRQFQVGRSQNNQVLRKQFPLQHAAAKTIHRCQGDTLDQVVLDLSSNRKEPHMHYVGLSRVKTLEGLFILTLNEQKIHVSDKVQQEMTSLRSDRYMHMALCPHTAQQSLSSIAFLNARSLHKHIDDIRNHHTLMSCDIHMYCETRATQDEFTQSDMYAIPGFKYFMFEGSKQPGERSHYGIAIYSRHPILSSCKSLSITDSCNTECALLSFTPLKGIVIHVACIYCRPSISAVQLQADLTHILKDIRSSYCVHTALTHYSVIMGDFNSDWGVESTRQLISQTLHNFTQLVRGSTTDYNSTLDHIYTDIPLAHINSFVSEAYFTDHKPVICVIQKDLQSATADQL